MKKKVDQGAISVSCLLWKHEDLSLVPRNSCFIKIKKKYECRGVHSSFQYWEAETGASLGLVGWLVSPACWANSRPVRDLVSKIR